MPVGELAAVPGDARLGESVTIEGDIVVVGVPWGDSTNGTDTGAAYVLGRDVGGDENWGVVRRITASDGLRADLYGDAVAISADTLVVGASYDTIGENNREGSAYVYEVSDFEFKLLTTKTASLGEVIAGAIADHTIRVRNEGEVDLVDLSVGDQLPDGLELLRVKADGAECTAGDLGIDCKLGLLPPGGTAEIVATVATDLVLEHVNTARVTSLSGGGPPGDGFGDTSTARMSVLDPFGASCEIEISLAGSADDLRVDVGAQTNSPLTLSLKTEGAEVTELTPFRLPVPMLGWLNLRQRSLAGR